MKKPMNETHWPTKQSASDFDLTKRGKALSLKICPRELHNSQGAIEKKKCPIS